MQPRGSCHFARITSIFTRQVRFYRIFRLYVDLFPRRILSQRKAVNSERDRSSDAFTTKIAYPRLVKRGRRYRIPFSRQIADILGMKHRKGRARWNLNAAKYVEFQNDLYSPSQFRFHGIVTLQIFLFTKCGCICFYKNNFRYNFFKFKI